VTRAEPIVVLRGGGVGDVVFVLPALEALRAAFDAEITLVGPGWLAELVLDRPAVAGGPSLIDRHVALPDDVVAYLATGEDPHGAVPAFGAGIAAGRPAIAIQLHGGGTTSNPLIAAFGARVTVGCRAAGAPAPDRWIRYIDYAHEVFRHLEVVGLVGAPPVSLAPRLATTPEERAAARAIAGAGDDGPLVVLHPSASDPRRRWPSASFAAVGRALARDGAQIVIVGNEAERGMTAELTAAIGTGEHGGDELIPVDLGGRLPLPVLAALLAEADVMIGNDSGPLHLARAAGAPTVGIFWCGNVINAGAPFRHRHRQAISWRLACPVCGVDSTRGACDHDASFVADVTVDEVLSEARELLALRDAAEPGSRAPSVLSRLA